MSRISSNQFYLTTLHGLNLRQQRVLELQMQSGREGMKKVNQPSDDPIAFSQIEQLSKTISFAERLNLNVQTVDSSLRFQESVIKNSVDVLHRVRELQVQAGNGALSYSDRQAIATELNTLLDQMQGFANASDTDGQYLFSGGLSSIQAVTKNIAGQYVYNGDETIRMQDVTNGLQIAINSTADNIFMRLPNGNGRFQVSEGPVPNTGSVVASSGRVVNQAAYIEDNYTLSFATNTAGATVVMVTGSASGNVLPPTGLPDDAPVYQSGSTVTFNGLEIQLTGTPVVGDSFVIKPSTNESIFSTMQRMIANLSTPLPDSTTWARSQTENNQLLDQLDTAISRLIREETDIGARLSQLDTAEAINSDNIETATATRSLLQDGNPAEVISALAQEQLALEIAQKTFTHVQGLSIFNYI